MSRLLRTATALALVLATSSRAAGTEIQGRASVTDGDTISIHGQSVRLYGIDAPESAQTCTRAGKPWRCGQQAANALDAKIGDRPVRCASAGTDRYGRMLGRCRLGGEDLGAWMVRNGWALAFVRYSSDYVSEERAAERAHAGIWAGSFTPPWDWRAARRAAPAASSARPASGCVIKGNINGDGQRIYHLPGQQYYATTQINPKNGERWFCTEAEARAAGWRRSQR